MGFQVHVITETLNSWKPWIRGLSNNPWYHSSLFSLPVKKQKQAVLVVPWSLLGKCLFECTFVLHLAEDSTRQNPRNHLEKQEKQNAISKPRFRTMFYKYQRNLCFSISSLIDVKKLHLLDDALHGLTTFFSTLTELLHQMNIHISPGWSPDLSGRRCIDPVEYIIWSTLQGSNISHHIPYPLALLKMIFRFSRWDMLVSGRACLYYK